MHQTAVDGYLDEFGLQLQVLVLHLAVAIEMGTRALVVEGDGVLGRIGDGHVEGVLALRHGVGRHGVRRHRVRQNGIGMPRHAVGKQRQAIRKRWQAVGEQRQAVIRKQRQAVRKRWQAVGEQRHAVGRKRIGSVPQGQGDPSRRLRCQRCQHVADRQYRY